MLICVSHLLNKHLRLSTLFGQINELLHLGLNVLALTLELLHEVLQSALIRVVLVVSLALHKV